MTWVLDTVKLLSELSTSDDLDTVKLLSELSTVDPIIKDEYHILRSCTLYEDLRQKLSQEVKTARFLKKIYQRRFPKDGDEKIGKNKNPTTTAD